MNLLPHVFTTLALNAIPALGWYFGQWNSGTTLAIYWVETVLSTLFIALRIAVHRRFLPVKGHYRYEPPQHNRRHGTGITYLRHFVPIALIFSAAHGVFLAVLFGILTANGRAAEVRLDPRALATGCGLVLLFQMADFLVDVSTICSRPFRWVELLAERNLGRVIVVHLTIILGLFAAAFYDSPRNLFVVFLILKTLNDLSGIIPQYNPDEPPRWLCRLMDRVPPSARSAPLSRKHATFRDYWIAERADERRRIAANEEPFRLGSPAYQP
jgi:hypothetical protein